MPSRFFIPAPRALLCTAAVLLLGLSTACGGGDGASADSAGTAGRTDGKEQAGSATATASCAKSDTTALGVAVRDYIAKSLPTPLRFLNAVGTDSAVPEDGFKVLQDKGPTYFYGSDTAAQRKLRDKLAVDGPWPSLLVVYRGQTESDGGSAVDIRLGGHYVGGEHHGKVHVSKRYGLRCDSTGWRIATTTEEPAT